MNAAGRYNAKLVIREEIHPYDVFIDRIIIGYYSLCVENKDSSVNAYCVEALILTNTYDRGSDI